MNNLKTIFACSALITLAACNMDNNSGNTYQKNMDLASAWVTSSYSGKAEATETVSYTHLRAHET